MRKHMIVRRTNGCRRGSRYISLPEELVVTSAQCGDREATEFLLQKYRNLVRSRVRTYFLVGAERDDLLQVGMIGLWEAIVDYQRDRDTSFARFAKMCVERQMISAVKTATRHKQMPLNSSISLESSQSDDSNRRSLPDIVASPTTRNPEEIVLSSESKRLLFQCLERRLSDFEWRVLRAYQTGKSYKEMASDLECPVKSIDNALSRIRRKIPRLRLDMAIARDDAILQLPGVSHLVAGEAG
jgi:RNA polymerase sporulation-specific sigma factor